MVPDPAEVDGFFICGPGPMMDAAEGALLDRNVPKEPIHLERFTADRPAEPSRELRSCRRRPRRQRSGHARRPQAPRRLRRARQHPRQRPRLGPARALRLQGGRLRDLPGEGVLGEVEMAARYGLTDEEVAAGYVLTCQSVPNGDGVELDYDA